MLNPTLLTIFAVLLSNINFSLAGRKGGGRGRGGGNKEYSEDIISVQLEGGTCLYGDDYYYFVRPGNPKYVAIIFSGGGFCFTEENCPQSETIDPNSFDSFIPELIAGAPFNDDIQWTVIILPQCTEDFHLGFQPLYTETLPVDCDNNWCVSFMGANNIDIFLRQIESGNSDFEITKYIKYDKIKHLTLWGVSSGNLGAAAWAFQIFDKISEDSLKTLVLDGWAIGNSLQSQFSPILNGIYNLPSSPVVVEEVRDLLLANSITLSTLVQILQKQYCELFVSSLLFEIDSDQTNIYAALLNDPSWVTDENVWLNHMINTVLPEAETYAPKRSSYYVAQGLNHVFMFPQIPISLDDIKTECDEDQNAQEYLSEVIGSKEDVRLYYGNPQERVQTFPKYSYNSLDDNCLQCDDDESF